MLSKKISKFMIATTVSAMSLIPGFASAEDSKLGPLSQVQIIKDAGSTGVDAKTIYNDMNSIVELIFYGAGFFSLVSLIIASVLLATSGHNPQRRSAGFAALGMSLLGGWILYKSTSIAQWLGHFGSS